MAIDNRLLTAAEYAALDAPEHEFVSELVRGEVVREPRPGSNHGRVQVNVAYLLEAWARTRGAVVTVESGFILGEDPATVRGPDVAVTLDPRPTEGNPGGWMRGAPDVAVEVLSPSDASSAIQRKTLEYLEGGARLVWIVDPVARTVLVYRPDGTANLLLENEVLDGEGVLEGFSAELGDLFD